MKVTLDVKSKGLTDKGVMLLDKEGKTYFWVTKRYNNPLFYTNDWIKVTMDVVENNSRDKKLVRNIRVSKN